MYLHAAYQGRNGARTAGITTALAERAGGLTASQPQQSCLDNLSSQQLACKISVHVDALYPELGSRFKYLDAPPTTALAWLALIQ